MLCPAFFTPLGRTALCASVVLALLGTTSPAHTQTTQVPSRTAADLPSPRIVDDTKAAAAGIRKLTGKYLVLYTNAPSSPAVDDLPGLFDLAVPQWAKYFHIDEKRLHNWRVQGFLIDRESGGGVQAFESLGLMPAGRENFPNGISVGRELWLYKQPSDYYTRHLLLHEGTHVFMMSFLGGCGPGWYMEGMAELFGTHRYDERYKQLTMRVMPANRDEVPMWGRIKLIHDDGDPRRPFAAVLNVDNSRMMGDDQYAWCWAATKFLDSHPRYAAQFRKLQGFVNAPDFNDRFRLALADRWVDVQAEWLAFIAALDYGYDSERMAIDFRRGQPLAAPTKVQLSADRGWQSSGVWLEAGQTYRIDASGVYEIANDGQPWSCEPNGVTIDYHDGRPLGMLLGAIDGAAKGGTLADDFEIGLGRTITPVATGTLYLRVNDSPAKLHDNRGTYTVSISRAG